MERNYLSISKHQPGPLGWTFFALGLWSEPFLAICGNMEWKYVYFGIGIGYFVHDLPRNVEKMHYLSKMTSHTGMCVCGWVGFTVLNGSGNSALFMVIYGCIYLLNWRVGGAVLFNVSRWAFDILMGRICRVMCEKFTTIESVSSVLLTLDVFRVVAGRTRCRPGELSGKIYSAPARRRPVAPPGLQSTIFQISLWIFLTHN